MQIQEIIVRQVAEYRHSNGITLRQQAKDMNALCKFNQIYNQTYNQTIIT